MKLLVALAVVGMGITSASAMEVAKVNGQTITDKEMVGEIGHLNEGQRANVLKDSASRRQILNSVIQGEVLVQEAEKEKLDQDQEYKDALDRFHRQYLMSKLIQKTVGPKITESAVKSFYNKNKLRYSTDQVHAQHILVDNEQKANEILKMAEAPNADFQALAEKYSKDPSAKNNRGDIGYFTREMMVPEFTEPAFAAKTGEIIGPVKTTYGYHIIKIVDRKAGHILEFGDVSGKVTGDLRNELTQNYLNKLRAQAKIEIDEKALEKL